jgi:transposase
MVDESLAPGASVSKVAQRYGVNANQLFTWRRQEARGAATGGLEPLEPLEPLGLLPVTVADEGMPAASIAPSARPGRMEIALVGGERIVVGADVDASALARVVKALSRR